MARILVIDDSPTVVAHARRALSGEGHEVDTLASFTELPECMRRWQPDVVLLDLEMPAMSGQVFARFIRKCEPRRTLIVVNSSLPRPQLEEAAREIGAVGVVEKGSAGDELRRAVASALRHAGAAEVAGP